MDLSIRHRTTFVYEGKAHESVNEARLRPLDDATQVCRDFTLSVTPDADPRAYEDFYGNTVHYFEVFGHHTSLTVEATSIVATTPTDERPPVPIVSWEDLQRSPDREMLAEFYSPTQYVPLDDAFRTEAEDALAGGPTDVWADVRRLGEYINWRFTYMPMVTGVETPANRALELRRGVCQDFAHVHLGLCRSLGLPTRYVSGYFFNDKRPEREAEASHAWIEAWLPDFGWVAYDPTHAREADERYVKIATGRDYADIRPVSGTYRGAPTRVLEVDVEVRVGSGNLIRT